MCDSAMNIGIRLKQYSSRILRLSMRPWVAFVATLSLIFYLAIFSAALIHVGSDQRDAKLDHGSAFSAQLNKTSTVRPTPIKQQHKPAESHKEPAPKTTNYKDFLRQPIINFHNFSYIHNVADACTKRRIDLVIVSPSGPGNFYRRMMARKSNRILYTGNPENHATHLFFIGSSRNPEIQRKIAGESKNFGDIVQESYIDVYANITFKAVQMLKWVTVFCNSTQNVIRLDDDVTADIDHLLHAMSRARQKHPNFVMGDVKRGWAPCNIPKCKTTKEEYPYATLPPFALGGALGYPISSVQRLYEATKRLKRFKLDDVYVTGMCAPKVEVKLLNDKEFSFKHGAW